MAAWNYKLDLYAMIQGYRIMGKRTSPEYVEMLSSWVSPIRSTRYFHITDLESASHVHFINRNIIEENRFDSKPVLKPE